MRKIVLASKSLRRKQLLESADIDFDIIVRETGETFPEDLPLQEIPVHIARNKALAVQSSNVFNRFENNIPILAADTVVVLDDEIIGKPENREEAIATLKRLSGRVHKVITGVVLLTSGSEISFAEVTEVSFHPLSEEQIVYYVDTYKPFDKAGAYAIQEWIGITGIEWIKGDFYNVMGLPISKVVKILAGF